MKRIRKISEAVLKLSFSAVLLYLFFIVLGAQRQTLMPYDVDLLLEYCAQSCTCALAGGALMDYILKDEE